jgi:peptidoglycan/LPS O-acetylase OafA/YrhL
MKSFLAVLAGLVVTIVLSVGVDVLLVSTGLLPAKSADYTDTHWAVITGYRVVIAIFGCWLAARLAPSRPMNHALITGAIGMCIAAAGAIFAWNKGPAFGPHWYAIALVITALPCAWIGGKINGDIPRFLAKGVGVQHSQRE